MKKSHWRNLPFTDRARWSAIPLLLLCPLGCGVPAQATNPDDYSAFLKLSYQQTCEARHRCCGTLCSAQLDTSFYKNVARTLDYIDRGLIQFDKQAATDCLSSQSERFRSCEADVLTVPLNRCDKVLVPKAGAGAPCETGVNSCIPDTLCAQNKCVFRGKLGDSCSSSQIINPCMAGMFCAQASGTTPAQCTVYSTVGKSCASPARCDPTGGLVCLPSSVCGTPLANTATCQADFQCASMYCEVATARCTALPVPTTVRLQLCALPEPTFPQ